MVEGRQRADHAAHDGHGMRVAAEATQEKLHLFMNHCVVRDGAVEFLEFIGLWQFAVQQQKAGFEKVAAFGNLFDGIAAIEQHAFVTVNIGDLAFAARRRREPGVIGEVARLAVKFRDVHHIGAD